MKLKSCPFCAGEATIMIDEISEDERCYLVCCEVCDGMVERWFPTVEDAINAWNRRANDATDGRRRPGAGGEDLNG
jgi:Lar family restriction alleviation protein